VLRPAWPADPQKGPFPEVLQTIRRLLIRPGRFRLERELPGGVCTHDICAPWQGTQWNKIEHRLFSFISHNWRARPLVSYQVIIDLISATTTKSGLKITCELDTNTYEKGIVVSDDDGGDPHHPRSIPW
jgi:Rhodopirellula transposase DDE domain